MRSKVVFPPSHLTFEVPCVVDIDWLFVTGRGPSGHVKVIEQVSECDSFKLQHHSALIVEGPRTQM